MITLVTIILTNHNIKLNYYFKKNINGIFFIIFTKFETQNPKKLN